MSNRRWHDWKPIIEAEDDREEKEALIKQALSEPYVKRKDGLLFQSNQYGKPHDAMSQVDMGQVLLRHGIRYGLEGYIDDAEKCLKTVTNKVSNGGLRKTAANLDVAWFHAITSMSSPTPGWTLNKHLHACRGLLECADIVRPADVILADEWDKFAVRGMRQLDIGEPRLKTYLVPGEARSWLYYSLDDDMDGRFLVKPSNPEKNGGYHMYVMELIEACDRKTGGMMSWAGVRPQFEKVLKAYKTKLGEGLYIDSKAVSGGNFKAISDSKPPVDEACMAWWNAHV